MASSPSKLLMRPKTRQGIYHFLATCPLFLFSTIAAAADQLSATFSSQLEFVEVRLCFDGQTPEKLYRNRQADALSDGIFHEGKRLSMSTSEYSLNLPALPDHACINWRVNLAAALRKKDYRLAFKVGDDLLMTSNLWFWKGPMNRDIVVDIGLPDDMSISAPWRALESTDSRRRFRPEKTSSDWESRIAVGTFKPHNITTPGANIRLAAIGNLTPRQRNRINQWIEESVVSVTAVSNRLPQPGPQVLVIPIGKRNEAVVHGKVLRGGGLAAVFYIDETRDLDEFSDDWTATHEFSHMLLPYISSRDRWLSEGLASYYQNVLRARDGRLTARQAWQNLYDGFQRGEKNTSGDSLARATRAGRRSTMRVYWSGAAMMLMADIQLRRESGGQKSLDSVLGSVAECCMENGVTWRARDMFAQMDRLSDTDIFTGLYRKFVNSDIFPDTLPVLQSLGINVQGDQVVLLDDGPLVEVRESITD